MPNCLAALGKQSRGFAMCSETLCKHLRAQRPRGHSVYTHVCFQSLALLGAEKAIVKSRQERYRLSRLEAPVEKGDPLQRTSHLPFLDPGALALAYLHPGHKLSRFLLDPSAQPTTSHNSNSTAVTDPGNVQRETSHFKAQLSPPNSRMASAGLSLWKRLTGQIGFVISFICDLGKVMLYSPLAPSYYSRILKNSVDILGNKADSRAQTETKPVGGEIHPLESPDCVPTPRIRRNTRRRNKPELAEGRGKTASCAQERRTSLIC